MTFFKSIFINLFVLAFIVGCSGKVEDKNAGLSRAEKDDLREQKVNNSIEISSVSFVAQNEIKENETADSNIVGKYYAVKVCLKDKNLAKGLGNRSVEIEGERKTTDSDGCIIFDHEIAIEHKKENRCKVFEKAISFGKNKKRKLNYSIDYYNDKVADLGKTKGCTRDNEKKVANTSESALILEDIELTYVGVTDKVRSDMRWLRHQTMIQSCLKVKMTGKELSNAHIQLIAKNQETGEVVKSENKKLKTKNNGCFTTDIVSKYEQFRTSHFMNLDLKIKVLSGPLAGEKIERTVYINPWEPSKYGIGQEGRVPVVKYKFKNKYARFHMDGVMFIQIGNNTRNMKVNDYLGLTISKNYQVVLNPYIYKEHRLSSGRNGPLSPYERLMHEGKFKLSMVVLAPKNGHMKIERNNYENFEFITGAETIVTVKNGIINTEVDIPFKMTDLPRLAVRTMSLFKLEPVGYTGLQSSVVTGFFKARIPWIKTNVFQAPELNDPEQAISYIDKKCSAKKNSKADECLEKIQDINKSQVEGYKAYVDQMFDKLSLQTKQRKSPFQMKISPKKIFVNHLRKNYKKLKVHTTTTLRQDLNIKLDVADFDSLLPENQTKTLFTENMKEELCRYGFHQNGSYRKIYGFYFRINYDDCLENPAKYFGVKAVRHIDSVNSIGKSYADGSSISISNRQGVNDAENNSETVSDSLYIGGDISGKVPVPFIGDLLNLGFKAGASRNWTTAHAKQKGYQIAEDVGSSKSLGVEKFVLDLNVNTERCIMIQSNDFLDVKLAKARRAELIRFGGPNTSHLNSEMTEERRAYFNPQKNLNMSFYVCDDQIKNEVFTESWYFVQSHIDSALARDFDGVDERKILKSFRGNKNYLEIRKALRDINMTALLKDNIGHYTPASTLVKNWGHLLEGGVSKEDTAKYLIEHFEGSFPGTIEGNGSYKAESVMVD